MKAAVTGICFNALLAGFKALVGFAAGSIAIMMDAVNNLSDALSSVITLAGAKFAAKAPDKSHPMGHGRLEYLSAGIIAVIILYAGITSLVESIKKLIHPVTPEYSKMTMIVVVAAIIVKLVLWRFNRYMGDKTDSDALKASSTDAFFDAVISTATLAAILFFEYKGISIESWLAAFISCVIIRTGIQMMGGVLSKILGERVNSTLSRKIKSRIALFPEVGGAYDLALHNYGPNELDGSVNIEVPADMTAEKIDDLAHRIQRTIQDEFGVKLLSVGIYSVNTADWAVEAKQRIGDIVLKQPHVIQMHGFYINDKIKLIRFDAVVDFEDTDRAETIRDIEEAVHEEFPDYDLDIDIESDLSD